MRVTLIGTVLLATMAFAGAAAWGQAEEPPPLSPTRAQALEPVLEASTVLDQQKPSKATLARFTRRCRALNQRDRLISGYRNVCRSEGDAAIANLRLGTCKSTSRCRARIQRYANDLGRQVTASRALNARLRTEVPDGDCRKAMRVTKRTVVALTRLRSASTGLVRAIARGTQRGVANSLKRFYSIDRSSLYDHRGRFDAFMAACT